MCKGTDAGLAEREFSKLSTTKLVRAKDFHLTYFQAFWCSSLRGHRVKQYCHSNSSPSHNCFGGGGIESEAPFPSFGICTTKFMAKKELLLNQLIESLEEQKLYLQTDICLALKGAYLEEKQIIALIDEWGLNLFQDPEISDALKEYLGEGFTLYIIAVARCEHILSDIVVISAVS
ncbi:hypothetical protein BDV40DRAFT_301218 [Aspergillus tamarii]|uniref:Uncharacterized protein n=1 Tax=Aspergillus tamarii TaxID=41984 RepID=A0A5N6USF3_ASPTM|nr:hypothetical protein BDV40DRAFT_301218 [Aspergillus tamarii]